MHPLDQFKNGVSAYLPGLLVLFDLADTKRRNCHLGHNVVANDIEEFDRLAHTSVGSSGLVRRVDGNAWLALYKLEPQSLQSLNALLSAYHKEQEMQVGWRSTGEKDSVQKVVERTVPTTIIRAARCLYSAVTDPQEINGLIDELFEQCGGFAPTIPMQLSDIINGERTGWNCVTCYPAEMPFCPFCEQHEFDWDDGDGTIYSGSGVCKNCGAHIRIDGIEQFAT